MSVGNLMAYALSVTASRRLGPAQFGVLGALLGLLVVGYVAALALQMVTTRRLASRGGPVDEGALTRTAAAASVGLGVLALLLAAPVAWFLHLDDVTPLLLLAVTVVPMTWSGYVQGVALGRERFGLVALSVLLFSVGKVGGGLVGLALSPDVSAVMAGTAVGTAVGVAAATSLTRHLMARPSAGGTAGTGREVAHVAHALLALYVLTNLDVLLARHFLTAEAAGLVAAGAIVAKIAFWLPQFVTVVALPRLADARRHHSALAVSVTATAAVGLAATATTLAAGDLVVLLVAGPQYEPLGSFVWLFAAEGSVFALAQLFLYGRLSRQDRTAVVAVWASVAVLVGTVATVAHGSARAIVLAALLAGSLLAVAGLVGLLRDRQLRSEGISRPAG